MSELQIMGLVFGGVGIAVVAFVIGWILGIWTEAANTKIQEKLRDMWCDETNKVKDQLSELKKQLGRIAEDL